MNKNQISENPFGKIAMSMSGGGYRAGAFHLGALSYLNLLSYDGVPLIENLKMISTVSGGSITGILYALKKQEGKSFIEFYDFFLEKLASLDLIEEGIKKLNPDTQWNCPSKHKNLINAFSELYDKHLTGGKTLGFLGTNTNLESFVFNSTEFSHAVDFRFRNKTAGYSGNYYFQLDGQVADEIKLADIMASSSCFPGGFEPMVWPSDFRHDAAPNINALYQNNKEETGIMDGGIYDNQGIDAILNYRKGKTSPYFDLIIVSDVASPYMPAYKPHHEEPKPKKGWYTYTVKDIRKKIKATSFWTSAILLSLTLITLALPLFWNYKPNLLTGLALGFGAALAILFIIKLIISSRVSKTIIKLGNLIEKLVPEFYFKRLKGLNIDEISLHRLEPLLMDRVRSLASLLMDVFLKIVRRQNYNVLYNNESYKYRSISNLVQELTARDFEEKRKRNSDNKKIGANRSANSILLGDFDTVVGAEIPKISEQAASFGTTLWFTEKDQLGGMLGSLVQSGRITMCYNILEYLEKVIYESDSGFEQLDDATKVKIRLTYDNCKLDWLHFKKNPATIRLKEI